MKSVPALLTAIAALSACADEQPGPPPFTCADAFVVTAYRIDAIDMPRTASAADDLGADLDGDRTVDNQLGNAISAVLTAYAGVDAEDSYVAALDRQVADGLDWQIELQTCPSSGESRAALADGMVPLGALTDFLGGGDDGWHPAELELIQFELVDGALEGEIAFGLAPGYAEVIARSFAPFATAALVLGQDAPDFDRNRDGEITEAELVRSELFVALTRPDVDSAGGDPPDLYSVGLGFHATAVAPSP